VQFRIDGHARYSHAEADWLCARLERHSVQLVLDPLAGCEWTKVAQLHKRSVVPIGLFGCVRSAADVAAAARFGAAGHVVIDPVRVGGLARARDCAAVAQAAGLAATLQTERTTGLALAACLQLAAATPGLSGPLGSSYPMLHDDILVEGVRMVDGMLVVPSLPGLGVEVDRDKLDRYQAAH
jgi:glucarate dehydratase